jgi:hypothetical protein
MKLIYIAGKLNGDACEYIQNVHRMVQHGEAVRQLGCAVALPCNDFIHGLVMGNHDYNDYFVNNIEILKRCDAIALVEGWEDSKGTDMEIDYAIDHAIPVLYDLDEVKEYVGR